MTRILWRLPAKRGKEGRAAQGIDATKTSAARWVSRSTRLPEAEINATYRPSVLMRVTKLSAFPCSCRMNEVAKE